MSDPWRKYVNNPILGRALDTCFDMSVLRNSRYQMWFSWRHLRGIGYAISDDGLRWFTADAPVLAANPTISHDSVDISRPFVIHNGDSYTMWYTGHSAHEVTICLATSLDGYAWSREGVVLRPELPWEKAAVMCPSVIRDEDGTYHLWYSGGERYEPDAVGYATSVNGREWSRVTEQPVLRPDRGCSWERDRVAGAHVFRHGDWLYAAYIGFANGFEDSAIGVARSGDGITWDRHKENPILRRGAQGDFDSINVYKPFVLIDDDTWRVWFNGSRPRTGIDLSIAKASNISTDQYRIEQIGYAECKFQFLPADP
jgi:predicted GH43/DUF377 family glycosyl hydrolase